MALHNYCVEMCDELPSDKDFSYIEISVLVDHWMSKDRTENQQGRRHDREHSSLQDSVISEIGEKGLVRLLARALTSND